MTELFLFLGGIVAAAYGSTAGGGGLVSMPILLLVGYGTPVAIATNRFSAVILEVVSAARFFQEGKLSKKDIQLAIGIGCIASIGAVLGSYIVISLDKNTLNVSVSVLLGVMMFFLLTRSATPQTVNVNLTTAKKIFIVIATVLLGIYGGMLGVGMGTLMAIILVGSGLQYVQSSAICRLAGVIWSSSASIVFAFNGMIDWRGAAILSAGFSVGGWVGAGIGAKKGEGYIRVLLILVMLASLVKLVVSAFG